MKNKVFKIIISVLVCLGICASIAYGAWQSVQPQKQDISALYLYGNMEGMTEKKDVRSVAALFTQGEKQLSCHATIKVQGTSSLKFEKKNYTISFYADGAHEEPYPVDLGWGKANEYCLKANWIDKTHARNVVTAKLAAEIQDKYNVLEQAPENGLIDGFPVEVYINDEYHGLYTWNIPKADWMFGMDEENPNHIVLCGENWEDAAVFRAPANYESWDVEVGEKDEVTLEKFNRLVDFVMNSTDEEFRKNFDAYLDLDAMLTYYIMVDVAYLRDNCGKNLLIATYDGEVWYPSLYDLDTSWGTHWSGEKLYDYEKELVNFGRLNDLAKRLETVFPKELHDRYFALRKNILSKEHILEKFYEFDAQIPAEYRQREEERWGEEIPGYDLSQIEAYLDNVLPRLDNKYNCFTE